GERLGTAGRYNTVEIRQAATGKLLLPHGGHEGGVLSLAFALDGKALFSFGMDYTLRRWDVVSGKERDKLPIPVDALGANEHQRGYHTATFALAGDGKQFALVVERERSIQLFDSGAQKPR